MDSSLFAVLDVLLEQRAQLDQRITEIINQVRRASRSFTESASVAATAQTGAPQKAPAKKRTLSAAGRKAISDALRRRHAEKKASQVPTTKSTSKKVPAKKRQSA